jgi:hypothetical protein
MTIKITQNPITASLRNDTKDYLKYLFLATSARMINTPTTKPTDHLGSIGESKYGITTSAKPKIVMEANHSQ